MPKHKARKPAKALPPPDAVADRVAAQIEATIRQFQQLPIPPETARFAAIFATLAEQVQTCTGIDLLTMMENEGLPSAGLCLLLLIHDKSRLDLRPFRRLLDQWQRDPTQQANLRCLIDGIIPASGLPLQGADGTITEILYRGTLSQH